MVIGISGVAGSGKDTFFQIFQDLLSGREVKRFALAASLKREAGDWTIPHYGIDPLNCSREEKETIRPFLVFHGVSKRHETQGRHWVNKLNDKVLPYKDSDRIAVITDIRYAEYEKDEFYWLREELGGYLVHVSQYDIEEVTSKRNWPQKKMSKVFTLPANKEELKNDPILKKHADYALEWPKIKDGLDVKSQLRPYVEGFISKINI